MTEFDNTNTIVLFENDKKGNDKRPDYVGKLNVDGIEKEVSVWSSVTKNGKNMFRGQVSKPYAGKVDEARHVCDDTCEKQSNEPSVVNDEIPF